MDIIKDKMTELRRLKNEVNNCILKDDETFEKVIEEFSQFMGGEEHIDIYNFYIAYNLSKGRIKKTKKIIDRAILKFPFDFELNTSAFTVYKEIGDIGKAIEFYCNRYRCEPGFYYNRTGEQEEYIKKNKIAVLEEIKKDLTDMYAKRRVTKEQYINIFQKAHDIFTEIPHAHFPMGSGGKSLIRKNIAEGRCNEKYLTNLYKAYNIKDVNSNNYNVFKTETLVGDFFDKKAVIDNKNGDVFAISQLDADNISDVIIKHSKKPIRVSKADTNLYYKYFSIPIDGRLEIEVSGKFLLSQIKNKTEFKKPKLIIYIFLDSLSQKFLNEKSLENIMPKTNVFFKKGYINKNCYCSSDWTLPCYASIATGKYVVNHNLYHPTVNYEFEHCNKMIQEYFKEEGYFTANICNNLRITPNLGYYRGFGRTIYQDNVYGFAGLNGFEVIDECIQHIEAFKHLNNYIELKFLEPHGDAGEGLTGTMAMTAYNSTEVLNTEYAGDYNENKKIIYENEIKRTDLILSTLYRYIEENYKDEEFVVCLNADHGQMFLEKGYPFMYENKAEGKVTSFLHESKVKVPFMIRGRNVPAMESEKLMENTDVMPTLLKICGIEVNDKIDGWVIEDFGGENKKYTYTEVYHPGSLYRAVITDDSHSFYFESVNLITINGVVDIDNYKVNIVNRKTNEIENEKEKEKIDYYINVVFDHIKGRIKI